MPNFLNMLSWWQWTILAAIPPAIVLLYFLKLKRRPIEVPSTYLWRKSTEDLHVNAIWQRLRRNLLLFLQLLVIALAAGALLRPSWQGTKLTGHRFVFLIDNSASMSAVDVKPTRLDEAKRQAGELIEQMRSGDAAMLISFADTARVEQSFTDNRQQLQLALKAIRPTTRGTSLGEALKLAAGLVNSTAGDKTAGEKSEKGDIPPPARAATLYIFSDGRFPSVDGFRLGNLDPRYVSIGSPAAKNVSITAFSVGRNQAKPDRLQVFARLENFGKEPAETSVKLFLDDRMIDAMQISPAIAAKNSQGVSFDLATVSSGVLRLELTAGDQLAVDDVAYAVINSPERRRVLLVTPGNRPLQLALRTKEIAELADVQIESPGFLDNRGKYGDPASAGAWQLIIYDRCRPKKSPACNTFYIGSLPPEGDWAVGKPAGSPQIIDIDTAHPLMQWLDLGDVLVAEASPLKIPRGGRMLVDSDAGPLMALAGRDAFEDVTLAFPITLGDTNWPIRSSFPTFAMNLIAYLGGSREAIEGGVLRPGMTAVVEWPTSLEICTPAGKKIVSASRSGKVSFAETGELGVYEARAGGKVVRRFAVNLFDPAESDILPGPAINVGGVTVSGESGCDAGRVEIWRYLVAVGLVVLLAEWYIYMRRVY